MEARFVARIAAYKDFDFARLLSPGSVVNLGSAAVLVLSVLDTLRGKPVPSPTKNPHCDRFRI